MLLKILLGLAIVVVVLVGVVATRPSDFRVARSAVISAPPAIVFDQINDLRKWQAWSPWAKLDPTSKATFAGPATGAGSSFTWSGNEKVGEGTMTILDSRPNEFVHFKLEFRKPFAGTNEAGFTLAPQGNGTAVTWTMTGRNNFLMKAVSLFMDCDKMVGGQFEDGLRNLDEVCKAAQNPPAQP
jgi:uncharacterized protein YndB with AHSA1/START domain